MSATQPTLSVRNLAKRYGETPVFSNVLGFGGNAWGDVFICTSDGDVYRIVPS